MKSLPHGITIINSSAVSSTDLVVDTQLRKLCDVYVGKVSQHVRKSSRLVFYMYVHTDTPSIVALLVSSPSVLKQVGPVAGGLCRLRVRGARSHEVLQQVLRPALSDLSLIHI